MMRGIDAVVAQGHRIASGACGDPRFPDGTIASQLPLFRRLVPDFEAYLGGPAFPGTINLAVAGIVEVASPEIHLEEVAWTTVFPPETFFLARAVLTHRGVRHPAFLYLPDPVTKPDHFQPPDRIELICAPIADLHYGDTVRLDYPADAIRIVAAPRKAGDDAVTGAR